MASPLYWARDFCEGLRRTSSSAGPASSAALESWVPAPEKAAAECVDQNKTCRQGVGQTLFVSPLTLRLVIQFKHDKLAAALWHKLAVNFAKIALNLAVIKGRRWRPKAQPLARPIYWPSSRALLCSHTCCAPSLLPIPL